MLYAPNPLIRKYLHTRWDGDRSKMRDVAHECYDMSHFDPHWIANEIGYCPSCGRKLEFNLWDVEIRPFEEVEVKEIEA